MLRLIKNEYIKLLRKGGFIALSLIFLAATILLPILGYVLSENEEKINNKLNGFVNDSLIQSEQQSGNIEYVKMLEFFNEEKISLYDEKDWRSFAGNVAFSSTRKVTLTEEKSTDNETNYDIEGMEDDEIEDERFTPDFFGRFDIASLYTEVDSKALCEEIINEIKNKDLVAFKKTFNDTIYPAYKKLKKQYGEDILIDPIVDKYETYHYAFDILDKNNIEPVSKDWSFDLAIEYGDAKVETEHLKANYSKQTGMTDAELDKVLMDTEAGKKIQITEYRLENNISEAISEAPMGGYHSESDYFMNFMEYDMLITFAGLILFMVGIGIIAKEFNQGTIKFLLVNPVKRSSIFYSKVLTLISMLTIASLWIVVTQLLFNTAFYGSYPGGIAHIYMKNGNLVHESGVLLIAKSYLNSYVGALMLCLTAIFLSSLIRNGAFAAGITLFAYLGEQILRSFFTSKGFYLLQFSLFPNVDLLKISKGRTAYRIQNFTFSSIVLIVHAIIFIWAARDAFVKKDV